MSSLSPAFFRGALLKVGFKPEPLRRAQAFLLYVALELPPHEFTADVLPKEIHGEGEEDPTLAGIAVGSLATMGLIERCGRCKSPSPARNGAWVNIWRLATCKRSAVCTWLERNGFQAPKIQGELPFCSDAAA